MRPSSRAASLLAALLFMACSGGGIPTPSPAPSVTPTGASTAAPTLAPTAPPSAAPTDAPTELPTPTDGPEAVELLISYADADVRATCRERDEVYPTELASITCGPEDLPFDYSLFETAADMNAEFDDDVDGAETPPVEGGSCDQGNHLDDYAVDGRAGRVNCREHTSSTTGALYHVIEWTDDNLLVIGYLSIRSDVHDWDELIDFWLNRGGPYAP